MHIKFLVFALSGCLALVAQGAAAVDTAVPIRLKDLVRVDNARPNPLVGYGLVMGLAGTGDTSRSRATAQSIANTLNRLGVNVDPSLLNSRNTAAVLVTASLPPFANIGDPLDISVSSLGDARSLAGGTLLMTPLQGPNDVVYALAQGPVTVGGFRYDAFGNLVQKNHPTVGMISAGATVEKRMMTAILTEEGALHLILKEPDFTTADRIVDALLDEFGSNRQGTEILAAGPDRIVFRLTRGEQLQLVDVLRRIEGLTVVPDLIARVVVNERTGTIVSGGDVRLATASITHGDLRVNIETDYLVSQPGFVSRTGGGVRTAIVPDTTITAAESASQTVSVTAGATVADLALALSRISATPRDVITIFQALHRAGALHAELIIQ
ncbi:flagellar basal body P-ring protein FlgI [Solimonas sp. K1W22B-7]|uniref:flagellar basal body P-ring protein FlgI n=1 Tax=Solimonas sp. K1W22B-7 TaxID=2303331 RepID=UPI000E32EC21|nr:flagellar basal body P-ring protein FlgI [Solimonas sp. K1W22B-7]AXQ28054.1 flagellar basal body P-ring protein FlgI [Solimonas sp. K1W22B-7]